MILWIKKSSYLHFFAKSPDVDCPASWGLVLFVCFLAVTNSPAVLIFCTGGASAAGHSGPSHLVTAMRAHQHRFSEEHSEGREMQSKPVNP